MYSERFSNLAARFVMRPRHMAGRQIRRAAARIHPPQVNDEISRTLGAFARRSGQAGARCAACMA
jgi:hypothetical protein